MSNVTYLEPKDCCLRIWDLQNIIYFRKTKSSPPSHNSRAAETKVAMETFKPLVPPDFDDIYFASVRISTMGFTCLSHIFSHEISIIILILILDNLHIYGGDYSAIPQYCWTRNLGCLACELRLCCGFLPLCSLF